MDKHDIKHFPEISTKLSAQPKKSAFERSKAEAEAKRLREEAETAAVYEDFVKSFEDDSNRDASPASKSHPGPLQSGQPPRHSNGPPKRHFGSSALRNSGPGSLGPVQSPSGQKRSFDQRPSAPKRRRDQGVFSFDDNDGVTNDEEDRSAGNGLESSEDEHERIRDRATDRAVSKPTIYLTSLPPGTSPAVIKALLASSSNLKVDAVRILNAQPSSSQSSTARRSISALVTLGAETPASDIDVTINTLKQHYLGFGYYLSLSRHLSSSALGSSQSNMLPLHSALASQPFGAKAAAPGRGASLSRAPPPTGPHRGGIAPPSSYNPNGLGAARRSGPQVNVRPPTDLRQLQLIHATLEKLIAYGPEFEALLMSRPEVQRGEKWAWLWDARSVGGVWYRWRLWELLSGRSVRVKKVVGHDGLHKLFDGPSTALWNEPEDALPFEFATFLEDVANDPGYVSSEDDMSDDEGAASKRRAGDSSNIDESAEYLNPLEKAKFAWLLSQLPMTTAKLRYGDVARITGFAIEHAGAGIEEVVDMMVENIVRPYCRASISESADDMDSEERPEHATETASRYRPDADDHGDSEVKSKRREDMSSAQLIALHLISDVLSASATSGVRHAWRYRALFESRLRRMHIFARLGRLERDLGWGRLRMEKWRRSVTGVLGLWEGWCVFEMSAWERFRDEFETPPLTAAEQEAVEREEQEKRDKERGKSRWKKVDREAPADVKPLESMRVDRGEVLDGRPMDAGEDLEGAPMDTEEELGGAPMDPPEDLEGAPMSPAEDLKGAPMDDAEDIAGTPMEGANGVGGIAVDDAPAQAQDVAAVTINAPASSAARRKRPRAEDMFASDDE